MFYNLNIIFRNLRRGGFYSVINIGGLAIGMAAAILILTWIHHEWSYDRFHAKEKQLYRVWYRVKWETLEARPNTSFSVAPILRDDYPDIVSVTRAPSQNTLFTVDNFSFRVPTAFVDSVFLDMFSFPLLLGNAATALNDPLSVILTEKTAKRLFGSDDPMGKSVLINNKDLMNVTGILKDIPKNTVFEFEALIPIAFAESHNMYNAWIGNAIIPTFAEIHPQANKDSVNKAISGIIRERSENEVDGEIFLFPLSESHLYSKSENGILTGGLIDTLRIFGLVAFSILLIACINFMNLSTARSEKRAKEVGVRKVMGGNRLSLIRLFFSESILLAFIAGLISVVIVLIALPAYNSLLGKQLSLDLTDYRVWLAGLAFVLFTGLLAGSYPAFYLSSFMPVKVLKGVFRGKRQVIAPRRILVILQFTVAIVLILSTLVIHRQVRYAESRDNGYRKDQLIYHPMSGDIGKNYELIKHDLLASGAATSVTRTFAPMTQGWANAVGVKWRGEPESKIPIDLFFTDDDWLKTVGTTVVEGRDLNFADFPTDSTAALLNETAVKVMGFEDPIGEEVEPWSGKVHVVGVIKDFILHSPYEPTVPMIIVGSGANSGMLRTLHIRLNQANPTADNLAKAEAIFKQYNPAYPFEYQFIDDEYARKFQQEQTIGSISTLFAVLTIFIACLGLFALVAYMAETRKKEIGIRKVLGASVGNVMILLSKEFLIMVLVSIAIASPVAWWAMSRWLTSFAYRTNIPWWLFVVVGVISLGIALLTVGFQAVKAATVNPVESIKVE
ncbi:MAG: ABC transporter permease [Tannerella sp.]|jgi:ABC-type antimicrobial peptide transport system permease subunit|nr:ABC transporter permease [Tannerella sp.]